MLGKVAMSLGTPRLSALMGMTHHIKTVHRKPVHKIVKVIVETINIKEYYIICVHLYSIDP